MQVNLLPGDVFCTSGNMLVVSALIRLAERIISKDDHAHYGHAGIVINQLGETIDTGWTVHIGSIHEFTGSRMIIARPTHRMGTSEPIDMATKRAALTAISATDLGRWYPVWRLPMHLAPPLAKYLGTGNNLVCSERTAKYLQMIGARPWPYTGVNPDTLADEWSTWRNFDIIFEGFWSD